MNLHHLLLLLCLCCPGLTVRSLFSLLASYCYGNWPFLVPFCQEEPTPGVTNASVPVSDEEDTTEAYNCRTQLVSTEEQRSLGGAIEQLGLQLLENLPIVSQQPNVILSPLSVALALAHLTLGEPAFSFPCQKEKLQLQERSSACAESIIFVETVVLYLLLGAYNETENLLLKALHAHNLPCYHHILGGLLAHFKNTLLEVATRMYLQPGVWALWSSLWVLRHLVWD